MRYPQLQADERDRYRPNESCSDEKEVQVTTTFRDTDVVTHIPAYTRKKRVYCGFRYSVVLRDQVHNTMHIYFDTRTHALSFLDGFGKILQTGQITQYECDAFGMRGFIHGEGPEVRNQWGERVMPRPGHPEFDALVARCRISEADQLELQFWMGYTAHNQEWYHRYIQKRYAQLRHPVGA